MQRALLSTAVSVLVAVLAGLAAAVGLAAFRGGRFDHELVSSLWIVGALMLLLGLFSATPSMRRGPDELMNVAIGRRFRAHHPADRDSGLGLSVILAVGGLSICAIALVVG